MAFKILCLFAVVLALADASDVQVLSDAATCANPAKAGDKLTMDYVGTIDQQSASGVKGKKFDSSLDRGTPFSFNLGAGEVIKGWDTGLVGICPGEKRNLVIQPADGYGAQGAGADIPGGSNKADRLFSDGAGQVVQRSTSL